VLLNHLIPVADLLLLGFAAALAAYGRPFLLMM
jgi:hypothetical protein